MNKYFQALQRCLLRAALVSGMCCPLVAGAQYYPPNDPRNFDYQRRESERKERENKQQDEEREASEKRSAALSEAMENNRRLTEKLTGDIERDRTKWLKAPALPADRNPLLGKWTRDKSKAKPAGPLAELNAMFSGPACDMFFGDGIWEFRARKLVGIDQGIGETDMGEVEYRANGDTVVVLPKQGMRLLMFQIKSRDRIEELAMTRVGVDACSMVRVGASANTAASAPSAAGRAPAAQAPVQTANVSPTPPVSSRPPPHVCQQTLLDKLGVVGINQVRQVVDVRFKEAKETLLPNSQTMRIDARGSACDDPRLSATLYDLDANGMLQSINYVWVRPPGPAPAPIFSERITQLSRFHSLPPPLSPSRLQADTSVGRLILEDLPERNLLLEAYKTTK